MKDAETKREFIRLRVEGRSYRAIEQELGISRSTCGEWEKELKADIDSLRQESLEELYEQYSMAREARIRRIGDTLRRIDFALSKSDLEKIPPERLLDIKLKYIAALKEEYRPATPQGATGAAEDTLEAIQHLYRRTASGDTTTDQAKVELSIIDHMVDGYNRVHPFEDFSLNL